MQITNINEALKAFNAIEDKRDEIRTKYESQDSKLKAARDQVEQFMLQEMKAMGLDAYSVPGEGVANVRVKRRFGGADWSLIWDFVVENKCPNMLQKRLLDTAVQQYLEETGNLPPGINTEAKTVIVVTKRG
jgi:hypothetical protein